MKKEIKKAFPKKAKLITDGGFYRIINIEKFTPRLDYPLLKKLIYAHQKQIS